MINFFYNLDLQLFFIINNYISNPILDYIFTFLHQPYKNIWFVVTILSVWAYFIYKHKKNRLILILIIPIGIIITDQIGRTIKNIELRERPYIAIEPEKINLLVKAKKNDDGNYKKTSSSKKSFTFSINIAGAKGRNDSRYFTLRFRTDCISRFRASAMIERLPRALGPNSMRP